MRLLISVGFVLFSQIGSIAAAGAGAAAGAAAAKTTTSDARAIEPQKETPTVVQNIDYEEIIHTTERRFKVVMSLMHGEGFKNELIEMTKKVFTEKYDALVEKWCGEKSVDAIVKAEEPSPQGAESSVPVWFRSVDDSTSSRETRLQLLTVAVQEAGKGFHIIFKNLFGEHYEKIKLQATETVTAKDSVTAPRLASSVTIQRAATPVVENKQDKDFLNLRFVLPPFADDLYGLHLLIKDKSTQSTDDRKATSDVLRKWLNDNVPNIETQETIEVVKIKQELNNLYNTVKLLEGAVLAFKGYNMIDENLSASIEQCKKMNSASFGTVGFLVAAVLLFTMW